MANLEFLRREPDVRNFRQGETISSTVDPGDCMYAAVDGTCGIELNGKVIETIASGGVFGEKPILRMAEMAQQFALQTMRFDSARLRRRG